MRVIAGKARRLVLKTPQGMGTRPTPDRLKETLFNMIQNELYGIRFLDLFSGSGGIGIEALSRGAAYTVFVDEGKEAVRCIKENLRVTKLEAAGRVLNMTALAALRRLEGEPPFQIIFMDPPYDRGLEQEVLQYLAESSLLAAETRIIIEASLKTSFDYLDDLGFQTLKRKEYKTNVHMFIKSKRGE